MNGLEITRDHEAAVDFSNPYYYTFEQLAVRAAEDKIQGWTTCAAEGPEHSRPR
ncbi:MAG: hypothetical protein ACLQAT_04335 [Candidatus Binataceae bacterium]